MMQRSPHVEGWSREGSLAIALLLLVPLIARADDPEARRRERAIAAITQANPFGPYKPPPPPAKPVEAAKPVPKVVKELRETFVITGFLWDNGSQTFQALLETRDGTKRFALVKGQTIGDYEVAVVLDRALGLVHTKTKKPSEIELGGTVEGAVIGTEEIGGSTPAGATPSPGATATVTPAAEISDDKRREILEKLKARRAAQMGAGSGSK